MNPKQLVTIEVAPDEGGGWKITEITSYPGSRREPDRRILGHERTFRQVRKVAKGAALVHGVEVKVHKKSDGRYSKDGASYGHDPKGNG